LPESFLNYATPDIAAAMPVKVRKVPVFDPH